MSAKCGECWEPVTSEQYRMDPDDRMIAGECDGYCGQWLCEDCSIREGGICSKCKKGLAEP